MGVQALDLPLRVKAHALDAQKALGRSQRIQVADVHSALAELIARDRIDA